MRTFRLLVITGVLVAGIACGSGIEPAAPTQDKGQPAVVGPKWEYKVIIHTDAYKAKETEALLNPLGEDGWELVSATHTAAGTIRYVFKRPKRPA